MNLLMYIGITYAMAALIYSGWIVWRAFSDAFRDWRDG